MISPEWQEYLDKMRELEAMVKLTAYHTQACARATRECAYYTQIVTDKTKEIIKGQGDVLARMAKHKRGG